MTDNFLKAYEALRTHRIDLNLLFDINVEGFIQKTDEVISQIAREDYLNLFLTGLSPDFNSNLEYILTPEETKKGKDTV